MSLSERQYVAVFSATSAAGFLRADTVKLTLNGPHGENHIVRIGTRYLPLLGKGLVPRGLWVDVTGPADSINGALARFQDLAGTVVAILALATNAGIDDLTAELVFDATEGLEAHEFEQYFLNELSDLPQPIRHPDIPAFGALVSAILASTERDRLIRSVGQYDVALKHMKPGDDVLAMAHLWMAVEALTKVALQDAVRRAGTREALLDEWGVRLESLDGEVRRRLILNGDSVAYAEARKASDGLEHGYLDVAKIREYSVAHALTVAGYVRDSILRFAVPEGTDIEGLRDSAFDAPLPSGRIGRLLRAVLVGPARSLAPQGSAYPNFIHEWTVDSVETDERGLVTINPRDALTPVVGDGIEVRDVEFKFRGPLSRT